MVTDIIIVSENSTNRNVTSTELYFNCRSVKVKDLSPQNKVQEWVQTLPTAPAACKIDIIKANNG